MNTKRTEYEAARRKAIDIPCEELPCPQTVRARVMESFDPRTHEIPSSSMAFDHMQHFVTVRGDGDIWLTVFAHPDPGPGCAHVWDWEAEGGEITSPAVGNDKRTAKISRDTAGGEKIVVRLKFNGAECGRTICVWIVWCTLSAKTHGLSTLFHLPSVELGLNRENSLIPDEITDIAYIHLMRGSNGRPQYTPPRS